jgi:hypothetical protein
LTFPHPGLYWIYGNKDDDDDDDDDSRGEDKRFWTKWYHALPEFNLLLISS